MPIDYTKPCVRCGAADRDATGRCRPCWRITFAARNARSPLSPPVRPLAERFWAKVDKNGPITRRELGPCWIWKGKTQVRSPYGVIMLDGRERTTHRTAFFLAHGRWPEPMACHHCDNPPCVKAWADELGPSHIYEGDAVANGQDAGRRGRTRLQRHPEMAHGENSPRAKLTAAQVEDIRRRYAAGGVTQMQLGREYGVTGTAIRSIIIGKNWSTP